MRSTKIKSLLGNNYGVDTMEANGDCFYSAICKAIPTYTIQELRQIISDTVTEITLDKWKKLWNSIKKSSSNKDGGDNDYAFMENINDLTSLKESLLLLSSSSKSSSSTSTTNIIWADHDMIQILANTIRVSFHIVVDGRPHPFYYTINPTSSNPNNEPLLILDDDNDHDDNTKVQQTQPLKHILLCLTRKQHYNLLFRQRQRQQKQAGTRSSNTITTTKEYSFRSLPEELRSKWE